MATAPEPLHENDARLAITALLVRLARSDHDYGADEIATITDILSRRYALSDAATKELLSQGEQLEENAPDTIRFTSAVKEAVALDDRMSIVSGAWRVVLADGKRSVEEDALMRMIPRFLGISDQQNNTVRLQVAREMAQETTKGD